MLGRYRQRYREKDFVTPPSTSDEDDISTTYNSHDDDEETESFSGMTSETSETEHEEEATSSETGMIGFDCTDEIISHFVMIVNYFTERNLPMVMLNQFPMGSRVEKKHGPYGDNDVLKGRVFRTCNQITSWDRKQLLFLIISDEETGQQYCLDKPYLLDWVKLDV